MSDFESNANNCPTSSTRSLSSRKKEFFRSKLVDDDVLLDVEDPPEPQYIVDGTTRALEEAVPSPGMAIVHTSDEEEGGDRDDVELVPLEGQMLDTPSSLFEVSDPLLLDLDPSLYSTVTTVDDTSFNLDTDNELLKAHRKWKGVPESAMEYASVTDIPSLEELDLLGESL
jgi:hypothetical protein